MSFRIEPATETDCDAMARVYVEAWRHAYPGILPDATLTRMTPSRSVAEWRWVIRHRGDVQPAFVARDDRGNVVGLASAGLSRSRDRPPGGEFESSTIDSPVGEVFTLYVAPDHQELGIGRRLLAAGLGALSGRRCQRAFLWVLRDNPARFFYERMGGQPVAERTQVLWGRTVPMIAYGWRDCAGAAARLAACPARES